MNKNRMKLSNDYALYKTPKAGLTRLIDGRQQHLSRIRLSHVKLTAGERRVLSAHANFEKLLVLLRGSVHIDTPLGSGKLGPRLDVFTDKAWAAYIPIGCSVNLNALSENVELLVAEVKAEETHSFNIITPDQVREKIVGHESYQRSVYDIIGTDTPAHRMIAGETINPSGCWSSFPPHKHDADQGESEARLEEAYYFRMRPENGFGFQRIYAPRYHEDRAIVVKHHSVVMIPYGYHPVAASPGYDLYYFWILAGDRRVLSPYTDPEHRWLL